MQRNLFRRVETVFPVEDRSLKERVISESLENYLKDNCQSWRLLSDGTYARNAPGDQPRHSAQEHLLATLGG